MYQNDYGEYVPIASANVDPTNPANVNPWLSWRASLLPYTTGFATFNCPGARDGGRNMELFHGNDEVTSWAADISCGIANWGTYGIMFQSSLPSFETLTISGKIAQGSPAVSDAFSSAPRVAWTDPANSVYAADACLSPTPVSYPSLSYKGTGTSWISPPRISPMDPVPYKSSTTGTYGAGGLVRPFADRHLGTNCIFVDGHVAGYPTQILDNMVPGASDCVWYTQ
jgi:prepilin-type processing-associated H-X9-DG protein